VALFGQLSWKVTDAVTIQPGARLNYDKKSGFYQRRVFTGTGTELTGRETDARSRAQLAIFQPQVSAPEDTDWNLTYDLTLSYEVAPDVLAYGTYAKSFKTIGINQNGLPTNANGQPIAAAGTIRPEKVDHVEIGLKSQFLNGKATLNLAAFRTEIRDYQATVINGEFGVLRGFLANAKKGQRAGDRGGFLHPPERAVHRLCERRLHRCAV
jgi:iron complex outermembrane receptor protein